MLRHRSGGAQSAAAPPSAGTRTDSPLRRRVPGITPEVGRRPGRPGAWGGAQPLPDRVVGERRGEVEADVGQVALGRRANGGHGGNLRPARRCHRAGRVRASRRTTPTVQRSVVVRSPWGWQDVRRVGHAAPHPRHGGSHAPVPSTVPADRWRRRHRSHHPRQGRSALRRLVRRPGDRPSTAGYGPLVPDPDGLLDLPAGFSYQLVSRAGDPLSAFGGWPALGTVPGSARRHRRLPRSPGWRPARPEPRAAVVLALSRCSPTPPSPTTRASRAARPPSTSTATATASCST